MSATRVLIAEDESLIAEELRDRLERMGLTVTAVVNSGEEAIDRAEETFPDLVLMDIQLKGQMDGVAAATTIRERFDIPIVYLTAVSDDVSVERAKRTCPLGFLLKPVVERDLRINVEMALQYHRMGLRQRAGSELHQPANAASAVAAVTASSRGFDLSHHSPSPTPGSSKARPLSLVKTSPAPEAIQEQLTRVLSSKTLTHSKRLVRFLSLIVEKALKAAGEELNEYLIGVEVYERPASFDPQIDTIVRTEARRLRAKLKQYYETEGINDPILIEVPKGSYAPAFRERQRGILDKSPGQMVSHYRLVEQVGEGGMGTIYLAEDTRLGRQVALKFIHRSQLEERHAKARLFIEARAAAAIDHPNVAAIYEVGEVDHQPFIVMAYLKGQDLEDRILEGPLEIQEALEIASQIADGLEAAHRQGVTHCDLNPSNVILSDDGWARIIDFGVAKLSSASRLSELGSHAGTANYVSPEQMKGEVVDQRTDIWSLGVILYEMLAGKKPFEGEHREAVYYAIAHKTPEPMGRWRPGIAEELEWIVFKCLEKEPASRYQDVAALKADLLAAQPSGLRTVATPAPPAGGEKTSKSETTPFLTQNAEHLPRSGGRLQRNAGRLAIATLAVLLVVAGSIWWFRTNPQPQPGNALTAAAPSIPRLVVLPFESRTPGEESQKLSYAVSDSLISHLSKLRGLEVTSWTTIVRLTERKPTLPEIAKILNVHYALEGSLLRSGQQAHLTVQLIRLSDDSHVWSEEFDFPWKDLLAVRRKISENVARQMKIQLLPEEQQSLALPVRPPKLPTPEEYPSRAVR